MATAEAFPLPPSPPPERQIVLTLSEAEARTLYVILANVGGDPVSSPRKHAAAVFEALRPIVGRWSDATEYFCLQRGGLVFNKYEGK